MSLYDDFRAPQYVDFANLHTEGPDSSSFFDHDPEITVTSVSPSVSQKSADDTLTLGSSKVSVDARDMPSDSSVISCFNESFSNDSSRADDTLVDVVFSPYSSTPLNVSKSNMQSVQTTEGPDSSSFFDHDPEITVTSVSPSVSQKSADDTLTLGSSKVSVDARDMPSDSSVISCFNGSFSNDTSRADVFSPYSSTPLNVFKSNMQSVQTKVRFMSPKNSFKSPKCGTQQKKYAMGVADAYKSNVVSPSTITSSGSSTPLWRSPAVKCDIAPVIKPVSNQTRSDRLSTQINPMVRSTPKCVNRNGTDIRINIIPPTPNSTVIEESCALDPSMTTPKAVNSENYTEQRSRRAKVTSANRRRSRSAGNVESEAFDDATILQNAMNALRLSCGNQSNEIEGNHFPSPQDMAQCVPQVSITEKRGKTRPKRKLSPVPRDYGRQPEKFISLAEQVAKNEKQTPTRFRTLPNLRKAVQSKVAKKVFPTSKERRVLHSSCKQNDQDQKANADTKKLSNDKGVKVARWPAPKVEPFTLTEYKKKEPMQPPRTMFDLTTCNEVLLRNRRTPIKRIRQPTKPQPFSFDGRDKDLLRRKQERMNGECDPQAHCCRGNRRRSKGDAMCKETGEKMVHHARIPVVLYKPPFEPQKAHRKPTKPIGFHLNTEKRAKEREVFDDYLRKKEDERQFLLQELAERKKHEEEREIAKRRKERVHKAHPMPVFHPFKVKPSNVPLTEPHTPPFMHRSHKGPTRKTDIPADDCMEC